MSNHNQSVDYEGFKGAGSPRAPPPQKPDTNPTRERLIMLGLSPILVAGFLIIFSFMFNSQGTLIPHIIGALCGGITIAIYDWTIEAYAYEKGLWFCYGGYQKVGKLDFKHVPVDMVIGFVAIGFTLSIASYSPQLFRSWGWNFWPISDPSLDLLALPIIIIPMSLFGAFFDFRSKRSGVWMNGPTWSYWKCAFYAWLPLLTSGIIVDRLILLSWIYPTQLIIVIILPFLIEIFIIVCLVKRIL